MKINIKQLNEIIDSNGELIGANNIPSSGADLETAANNTTDYNQKVGQQPYRYDMLSRFGFSLMPFMEGDESKETEIPLVLNDLAKLMYEKYMQTLEYYYRHPNKLKSDFRVKSEETFETQPNEFKKMDVELAKKIMKTIEPHYKEKLSGETKNIDEGKVVEDKMITIKSEDEISKKGGDNDIKDSKLVKIAGLLNKMPEKDVNKLITLLERK